MEIGQKAAICSGHGMVHFGWTVKKVTPTGQFTLAKAGFDGKEMTRRFDAQGWEIGAGSKYYRARALFNVDELQEQAGSEARRKVAAAAVMEVKVERYAGHYTKGALLETVAELEAKLAKARSLVEAI